MSVRTAGQETHWRIQYGRETSSWCQSHGSSGAPEVEAAELLFKEGDGYRFDISTGLVPGIAYCVGAATRNPTATTAGEQVVFTAGAPVVRFLRAEAELTTATLSASINPAGQPTDYRVEYGLASSEWCRNSAETGAPEHVSPSHLARFPEAYPAGYLLEAASTELAGLSPNTKYCGEMLAANASGTGVGTRTVFRTQRPLAPTPSPTTTAKALAPTLTSVRLSNRRFRVGKQATAISAGKARRGSSFHFTLTAPAKLQIKITRSAAGLRHGRNCLAPSSRLRQGHAKRCTRTLTVATLTRTREPKGAGSVPFSGRIGRHALSPGSYKAVLSASNSVGHSKPVTLSFTIVD